MAKGQAYLGIGGGLVGVLATILPHPAEFNETGLLIIQAESILIGLMLLASIDRVPMSLLRPGPVLGILNTSLAVYFSGYATSGFAMFYLWVGLYAFYFISSRLEAAIYVALSAIMYGVVIAVTPTLPVGGAHAAVSNFVIVMGTLVTASVLLLYLRGRLERLMGRLTDAARTDALTGLPNRVALHEIVEAELERARPHSRPLTVIVLDIDRFKSYNDKHGIEAGDRVLQRLGDLTEQGSRAADTVTRSAGAEFTIVLPETDVHRAFMLAEGLLTEVRDSFRAPAYALTASIGVASYPEHGDELQELLGAADEAMQAAKALGGDRPVIFSHEVTTTLGLASGRRSVESQAHVATVISLAEALDQRDAYTLRHSQTVGYLSELMAQELGLDQARTRRVRLAGILHDIGKIGVPDSILTKPAALDDEERIQMRRHPELGARILSSRELDDVRGWILAHHERPDGKGYPYQLTAEEIPIEASIVAIADAYEAMTSDRVYRLALPVETAKQELRNCAGTQFDPAAVEALLRALDREGAGVSP
jgi:diguanylate cyclase (GGDEF)-like protein/putative nucleotidyltransferase with HDIG domain